MVSAILDILDDVIGIVLLLGVVCLVWWVRSVNAEPRKLKRPLRPIARCTLVEAIALRDLAPHVSAALKQADAAVLAGPSTFRQASCAVVVLENDQSHAAFLLILQRADKKAPKHQRREIEFELRSGFSTPPAPRVKHSKRVLDAVDRALRSMSNLESIRWTRDRDRWFDRPFDA
jgi:hypothetical protein